MESTPCETVMDTKLFCLNFISVIYFYDLLKHRNLFLEMEHKGIKTHKVCMKQNLA